MSLCTGTVANARPQNGPALWTPLVCSVPNQWAVSLMHCLSQSCAVGVRFIVVACYVRGP